MRLFCLATIREPQDSKSCAFLHAQGVVGLQAVTSYGRRAMWVFCKKGDHGLHVEQAPKLASILERTMVRRSPLALPAH